MNISYTTKTKLSKDREVFVVQNYIFYFYIVTLKNKKTIKNLKNNKKQPLEFKESIREWFLINPFLPSRE